MWRRVWCCGRMGRRRTRRARSWERRHARASRLSETMNYVLSAEVRLRTREKVSRETEVLLRGQGGYQIRGVRVFTGDAQDVVLACRVMLCRAAAQ